MQGHACKCDVCGTVEFRAEVFFRVFTSPAVGLPVGWFAVRQSAELGTVGENADVCSLACLQRWAVEQVAGPTSWTFRVSTTPT